MKTTNTAKKKTPFHRDEPYKDISREEYMQQQPTFLLYPHGEGGKGDSLVKVEGGSFVKVEGGSLVR